MKRLGVQAQIGRTQARVQILPFDWSYETSMMAPRLFGFGLWITKNW